jgi:hypothetical protein
VPVEWICAAVTEEGHSLVARRNDDHWLRPRSLLGCSKGSGGPLTARLSLTRFEGVSRVSLIQRGRTSDLLGRFIGTFVRGCVLLLAFPLVIPILAGRVFGNTIRG